MVVTTRRALILIAACWHLMLTAVLLPAHLLSHASDLHCCATPTGQLGDLQTTQSTQHHSGDCQLCKLDSQLQPADVSSSGQFLESSASTILATASTQIASVFAEHFSGRAPPVSFLTTVVVG